ncbi:MAG: glycosyltransferase [Chthoniobacterales bacterium]
MLSLVHLTTYYSPVLREKYRSEPALSGQPYATQLAALIALRFGWSDAWKEFLAPLGYKVTEVIVNARELQHAWAKENGVPLSAEDWKFECSLQQIKVARPGVVFLDDYNCFSPAQINRLREAAPGALFVGWCGAPYDSVSVFQSFDIVLSNIPTVVEDLQSSGVRAFSLRHAFDERIRVEIPTRQESRITFCGSLGFKAGWHRERTLFLDALAVKLPLSIASGLFERIPLRQRILAMAAYHLKVITPLYRLVSGGNSYPALAPEMVHALEPAQYGLRMYHYLVQSPVTLNKHISASPKHATNMRLFEATGVGACLLTDQASDLGELFEPDQEVAVYRSPEECEEKARWLLDHPQAARDMALRGQRRTLRDHNFRQRAEEFNAIVTASL